jgi:signal transduction histidine kinase
MRTAGKFLIFSAVFLRTVVVLSGAAEFQVILILLTAYGLFMIAETWLVHRSEQRDFIKSPGIQLTYLSLQSVLVLGLLLVSNYVDFLAELFIPISLDAVSFFGRRVGFRLISVFSVAMTGVLLFSPEGPLFGFAMGVLYSGLCFVFGAYASQVQKAEAARAHNQQTYGELQEADRQLQAYADRLVDLAAERERNRLSRELHDSVTQTVFSMNLAAQSARLLWDREPVRVGGQLSRLEELAASAQREIQFLVSQLSPPALPEMSLPSALQKLAQEQESRSGLHVSLEVQGEENLSEVVVSGLYTITQEALTNVAKHSGCQEAVVRLLLLKGRSCLVIEDHGRGFSPDTISDQRGHLGLAGMSERAREMGWTLAVESQPGQGTCVRVSEPCTGEVA